MLTAGEAGMSDGWLSSDRTKSLKKLNRMAAEKCTPKNSSNLSPEKPDICSDVCLVLEGIV